MGSLAGSVLDINGDLVGLLECGVIPCLRKGSVGREKRYGMLDVQIQLATYFSLDILYGANFQVHTARFPTLQKWPLMQLHTLTRNAMQLAS